MLRTIARVETSETATTTQQIANRFACSGLSFPNMFPTRPDAANYTPRENMKIRPFTFIIATCAASSVTPKTPANIMMNSNAHHSKHIKAVVGTANFMKVNQSENVSAETIGALNYAK